MNSCAQPAMALESKAGKNRSQRAHKSASCMWINTQIITSSQRGISELWSVVTTYLPQMNLVNMTTAIHRLSKLVAQDPKLQSQLKLSPVFTDLLEGIRTGLGNTTSNRIQPQSLSNILWSLASCRYSDIQIIHLVCDRSLPQIDSFKPFELSTMLWAITKLSTFNSETQLNMHPISHVFDRAAKFVIAHASAMEFRCLSMIAWAYATGNQVRYDLFSRIALQLTATAHTAACHEMGNAVWAFGKFKLKESEMYEAIVEKAIAEMQHFKSQELSNMLWGFASCGFFHDRFYQLAASAVVAKERNVQHQHLADILFAFSRVCSSHVLSQQTILAFLPLCCRQINAFKAPELSCVALCVAKAYSADLSNLPQEVYDLFDYIPKALPHDMSNFSTQALTSMATAYATLGIFNKEGVFSSLGHEVVKRSHTLEPAELLRLFQIFLTANSHGTCTTIAGVLARAVAKRAYSFQEQDARALGRICMNHFELNWPSDLKCQELCSLCVQVLGIFHRQSSTDLDDAWSTDTTHEGGCSNISEFSHGIDQEPLDSRQDNVVTETNSTSECVDNEQMKRALISLSNCTDDQSPQSPAVSFRGRRRYVQPTLAAVSSGDSTPPESTHSQASWTRNEFPADCSVSEVSPHQSNCNHQQYLGLLPQQSTIINNQQQFPDVLPQPATYTGNPQQFPIGVPDQSMCTRVPQQFLEVLPQQSMCIGTHQQSADVLPQQFPEVMPQQSMYTINCQQFPEGLRQNPIRRNNRSNVQRIPYAASNAHEAMPATWSNEGYCEIDLAQKLVAMGGAGAELLQQHAAIPESHGLGKVGRLQQVAQPLDRNWCGLRDMPLPDELPLEEPLANCHQTGGIQQNIQRSTKLDSMFDLVQSQAQAPFPLPGMQGQVQTSIKQQQSELDQLKGMCSQTQEQQHMWVMVPLSGPLMIPGCSRKDARSGPASLDCLSSMSTQSSLPFQARAPHTATDADEDCGYNTDDGF